MNREPAPLTTVNPGNAFAAMTRRSSRESGVVVENAPDPVTPSQDVDLGEDDYDEVFGDEGRTVDPGAPAPLTAQPQTLGEMQALVRASGGEDGVVVETDAPVVFKDSLAESGASSGSSLAARMLGRRVK